MNGRRIVVAGAVALIASAALAGTAQAHPLGNFTVNQYDGLVVAAHELRVDHVEDLAEIPAAQAEPSVDRDGDRKLSPAELDTWSAARCTSAADRTRLTANGQRARLTTASHRAQVRPGQAGLNTLRVECRLTAALPAGRSTLTFHTPDAQGPGWREITARGDRTTLKASDVPEQSTSQRLTNYPQRLLSSPPSDTSATLTAAPGGPPLAADKPAGGAASVLPRGADRWTQALTGLVARHHLTFGFALLALATALLLGAVHALAPGHGKTLMAAAAAARGRHSRRDMVALGASVTVTHTLGVFALGALVAAGSAATPSVVSWLGVASGALVAGAGALLLRRAWRRRHQAHAHAHPHPHDHDHAHPHTHPTALSLRGTILLGFAGGMVPSPSAVLVLVGAAALGQAWFGFLLVIAYGAGLALTLTAAGFAAVRITEHAARRIATRRQHGGRLLALAHRAAPLSTAFVVFALGCGLLLRGASAAIT